MFNKGSELLNLCKTQNKKNMGNSCRKRDR